MLKRFTLFLVALLALTPAAKSQNFFDTSEASRFFTFGARLGFNTSNRTFPSGHFNMWNNNGWGTGLDVGIVANLNFKEYLTIQPGIFFDSRSGNYSYVTSYLNVLGEDSELFQTGHLRNYNLTIPIMGIVKFNVTSYFKWNVELGPYLQFYLKNTGLNAIAVLWRNPLLTHYTSYYAKHNNFDVGLKMGTGMTLFDHYYVGIHYLAGFCHTWGNPSGGHNKSWMFTIGYEL